MTASISSSDEYCVIGDYYPCKLICVSAGVSAGFRFDVNAKPSTVSDFGAVPLVSAASETCTTCWWHFLCKSGMRNEQ